MRSSMLTVSVVVLSLFVLSPSLFAQTPVGDAFTYQGRLWEADLPADGMYDFVFILYDAELGGAQVSNIIQQDDFLVTNGLVTLNLDFGPGVFTQDARWLEVGVRRADQSSWSILSPRQRIMPPPYSGLGGGLAGAGSVDSVAKFVGAGELGDSSIYDDGARVGIGTTNPSTELEVAGRITITGGSPGAGKVLTSDSSGQAAWETVDGGVPKHAIMFFNLNSCPKGWSAVPGAYGRYLVVKDPDDVSGIVVGEALGWREDRPTGLHRHYSSFYDGSDGGGIIKGTGEVRPEPLAAQITEHKQYGDIEEPPEGTNAPYIQFCLCQKD